jgi:hypothetical protein
MILPSAERREFFFHSKKYFVHFPDCFKCKFCTNQLSIQTCCEYSAQLLCKDCYGTGFSRICATCNSPVFEQGAKIDGVWWHAEHFVCSVCSESLKPNTCVFQAGVLKCRGCAANERKKCRGCGQEVAEGAVRGCGYNWHPTCFKCQFCHVDVMRAQFCNVQGRPCCTACWQKQRSSGHINKRGMIVTGHA